MFNLTFENPLYLLCLFLIPALIFIHFYLLKHSEGKAIRFANFESLKGVTGDKLITKNIWLLVLRTLILICVIVAASGLVVWHKTDVNENDFIIAIDISPSMSAEDVLPNRMSVAKQISGWLINNSGYSNIGIVSFSGITFIDAIPISNKNTLNKVLNNIRVKQIGGTDISGALITSTNLLLDSDKCRSIILISDGSETTSAFVSEGIQEGINYAKSNNVIVHTIGLGSENVIAKYLPEKYNLSIDYDKEVLLEISNSTGGIHLDIKSLDEFMNPYLENINETHKGMVPFEANRLAIVLALLLLFTEWILVNTRFRKIP
ncbi:MAG: VWA domain-containing protein [Nanoarchaeota archaeon]|nr:VWA domain-containing protein [Nanoarchaeota archaeon]